MIPYIPHPTLEIGGYELTAFRTLVLAAVLVHFFLVVRYADRFRVDVQQAGNLCIWAIAIGLMSAHVFDMLFYFPEQVRANPLVLLEFWGTLSSTGGMLGGILGLLVVMKIQKVPPLDVARFMDLCLFALPFTLGVGRLGCALQHDHLGRSSTHFLAVAFPDGPRFDLGVLEFLVCCAIAGLFLVLVRKPRPLGFFFGLYWLLYGPARFGLDVLRTDDARYLGLTPAQVLMILATLVGAFVLWKAQQRGLDPALDGDDPPPEATA